MKVRVIYAGGMRYLPNSDDQHIKEKLTEYLALQFITDTDVQIYSATANWIDTSIQLAQDVYDHYQEYDGFVVIHPLNGAEYVANVLAYSVFPLAKPVVFTGTTAVQSAQQASELYNEINFRTHLMSAVQLATMPCLGVMLAYDSIAVRAERAVFQSYIDSKWFTSIGENPLAEMQFGIQIQNTKSSANTKAPQLHLAGKHSVVVWSALPAQTIPASLLDSAAAILVEASPDHFPGEIINDIDTIPCIVFSPAKPAWTEEIQPDSLPNNIYLVPSIAKGTLLAKVIIGLEHYAEPKQFKKWLLSNTHKEFIEEV